MSERHHACVACTVSTTRRLGGGEAAVIVTFLITGGALALTGMPINQILPLLSETGLLAVALTAVAGISPLRSLRRAVRAALTSGSQH
ncbi:hypothetical protein [Streptomyces sp. NPDC059788]|uniref:hypothetical protein n=1 Tax=Streptomyces sp. NPDC059788 TaxID=3346948 RepID=UPI00364C2312